MHGELPGTIGPKPKPKPVSLFFLSFSFFYGIFIQLVLFFFFSFGLYIAGVESRRKRKQNGVHVIRNLIESAKILSLCQACILDCVKCEF